MKREEIMEVYKAECNRIEKTQINQWKFNIALWTLIALGIGFFDPEKVGSSKPFIFIAAVLFLIAHSLFIYLTQRALRAYRLMADAALDALNTSNDSHISFTKRYFKIVELTSWGWWWVIFQFLATLVLIMFFYIRIQH